MTRNNARVWLSMAVALAMGACDERGASGQPGTPFTISRETTRITEPLRSDGYPDYVAALNEQFSRAVTPENNAAVPFWKAVGPEAIEAEYRDRYFQMLGIRPLPLEGDYFVDLRQYLAKQTGDPQPDGDTSQRAADRDAYDLLEPALWRPWTKQEFPVLAAWLAANEKPLALVVEASRRPQWFNPLVGDAKTPLLAILNPSFSAFHRPGSIPIALTARAMLQLGEGKPDAAWNDLLACHRLARLVSQGPTVCDAALARMCIGKACDADQVLVRHASLTADRLKEMRKDLDQLPAMSQMADKTDSAERFTYLNIILDCARDVRGSLAGFEQAAGMPELNGSKELRATVAALRRHSAAAPIDWDVALRMGNAWFDRLGEAYRRPTHAARRQAVHALDEELRQLKIAACNTASLDAALRSDPRRALSERLGQILLVVFAPSVSMIDMDDRTTMVFALDRLALALAAYRADHGSYPARLDDLTPAYLDEVPKDIFSDAELRYRQDGKGYCLYSVGSNGRDDGGKGLENGQRKDKAVNRDWDDLIVRMPPTEAK